MNRNNSGDALRKYNRRQMERGFDIANYQNPSYTGPSESDLESEERIKEKAKTKEVSEIAAAMVFKNKAIWWFLAIILVIGIFFIVVFTVPQCKNLMCDCITGADGCAKDLQVFNDCLQSKSSKS